MNVALVGYRSWALKLYSKLTSSFDFSFLLISSKSEFSIDVIVDFNPDIILFYGWSWLIPASITSTYTCLMLHPSELPKFRGGSPIQNQIIRGVYDSSVTIFKINDQIDAGPIIAQSYLDRKLHITTTALTSLLFAKAVKTLRAMPELPEPGCAVHMYS